MALEDRRREMESRYAHDEEKKFKIESRRNRLFGAWAAQALGKTGPDAESYTQDVVKASFQRAGDDDILGKVGNDFRAGGVDHSDEELKRQLEKALIDAEAQLAEG